MKMKMTEAEIALAMLDMDAEDMAEREFAAARLRKLTMKELRVLGRHYFGGALDTGATREDLVIELVDYVVEEDR
jgi:hypothetical protein